VIAPMLQQKLFAGLEAQFNSRATTLEGGTASSFQVFNATLLGHAMGSIWTSRRALTTCSIKNTSIPRPSV